MEADQHAQWLKVLKEGDEEDIIKWPNGEWSFRHSYQDDEDGVGWVQERLLGVAYEVAPKRSAEWSRLQEARRLKVEQGSLNVSHFYFPPGKFPDEFIESLARSARESAAVGDGARAMDMAMQLYRASRSEHATGDAQRARALALHEEVLSYVDDNVVMDDRFRVMRAGTMKDFDAAVALLNQVTDPSWAPVAQTMIVSKRRELEGRSLANMRRIGDLEHRTTGTLKMERVHARTLIKQARKTGDKALGVAACTQLYRLSVIFVLAWDVSMRGYKASAKERAAMDAGVRKLMDTVDELDIHKHGLPKHERENCDLDEFSSLDRKWVDEYLGLPDRVFKPIEHLLSKGASWSLGV